MFNFTFFITQTIATAVPFARLKDYVSLMIQNLRCVEKNGIHGRYGDSQTHRDFRVLVFDNGTFKARDDRIPQDSIFRKCIAKACREDVLEYVHDHLDLLAFAIEINLHTGYTFDHYIQGLFFNTQMLRQLLKHHLPHCSTEQSSDLNEFEVTWYPDDSNEVKGYESNFIEMLAECLNHSERQFLLNGKIRTPHKYQRDY